MKTLSRILFTTVVFAAAWFIQNADAKSFEGKIKMKLVIDDKPMAVDYLIKNSMVRMEMGAEAMGAVMLVDITKGVSYMIMPAQRMYIEMSTAAATKSTSEEKADISKAGTSEKIAGYSCEKWIAKKDGRLTEIWAAKGVGQFIQMQSPMGTPEGVPDWQARLTREGYFPFRVIGHEVTGKEIYRMDVTSVEPQSLNESLFTLPDGFQKMEMPGR